MNELWCEFDKVFGDFLSGSSMVTGVSPLPYDYVLDKEGNLHIDFAMAGYEKEAISVDCEEGGLRLVANAKEGVPYEGGKSYHTGIKKAKISLLITMPDKYDKCRAKVAYNNGLLKITVPLKEENKQKVKIVIE